jgi:hypothetical protein
MEHLNEYFPILLTTVVTISTIVFIGFTPFSCGERREPQLKFRAMLR